MFKKMRILSLAIVMTFGVVTLVSADTFNVSLSNGSTNKAEVMKLQEFLFNLGYLKVTPTGSYLSLTQKAVADFQTVEGISPTSGYFGPLTRAAANKKVLAMSSVTQTRASVSNISISKNTNAATVGLSNSRTITWQTSNYPVNAGVNINLLRKTSDSPKEFSIIRSLAIDTLNDGNETWIPQSGESSSDMYVEVTCSNTYKFTGGCQLNGEPVKAN